MSQDNLAHVNSQPLQSLDPRLHPVEEPRRSPEIQVEAERLGKADTYLVLDCDEELFKWLDDLRDRRSCGYVIATEGAGLHKVFQYYRAERVTQRRGKYLLPVSTLYIQVEQHCGPSDLHSSILQELGHPLAQVGSLKDRRARARKFVKDYQVRSLIIDNAFYLTLEALNDLVDLTKRLQISIILAGTPDLHKTLERNSFQYIRIHNAFLELYDFPLLTKNEVIEIVNDWEELFLPENCRLNLTSIARLIDFLWSKSGKLREPLYDIVRKIATLKLDEPSLELSPKNLAKLLAQRKTPKTGISKKK